MGLIQNFSVHPLPMADKEGRQRIDIHCRCGRAMHAYLSVYRDGAAVVSRVDTPLNSGEVTAPVMLPQQKETFDAVWELTDGKGTVLARTAHSWGTVRKRTMYVMISSHMDIGLHESPYLQRHASCALLDRARQLCDETEDREEHDRFRYTMEGTWFWNNYGQDRGIPAARELAEQYLRKGKIGYCCTVAGNHIHTYGLEELCRSAYEKKRLMEDWGLPCETMAMIDNNGLPMSLIQPYADAGIRNLIFAPNHWNPLPSTVWKMDMHKDGIYLNPDAGGGGSRIDVRYDSALPMVFYWEGEGGRRLLVWASTQYGYGGASFGLYPNRPFVPETVPLMEAKMAQHLPLMEEKYPYDVWLLCCYDDNSEPNLELTNSIAAWNAKWEWPKLRTLGDTDEPFRILREKHDAQIPVLKGDITGGWYQHPIAAAELLAQKFEADRLLPTAEKWACVASVLDESFEYPATEFRRAWDHLLFNDEHSYGTSGYQGRRVYETWMQHRDWIEKARTTADRECSLALKAIASRIEAEEDSIALFNPTAQERRERIRTADGLCDLTDVPAFGYALVKKSQFRDAGSVSERVSPPPVIENRFYRVAFRENGSVSSIFDKELGRELLDTESRFRANELVYTRDNHKTFLVPEGAEFTLLRDAESICVTARVSLPALGAEICQTVSLCHWEKRIDIDNRICHAADLFNKNRYYRYLYYAFPFAVENCRRFCHLNGAVAEYAKNVTGHGTDVYMAVSEWCCAQNRDFGVALMMLDSQLTEFDHIHPDKTDFGAAGEGSQIFSYLANDWLQMHLSGGSHLDFRFRYRITSYEGDFQTAGIPRMAERFANPVQPVPVPRQEGTLAGNARSFLMLPEGQRLVTLKRADDGDGLIARLYSNSEAAIEANFGISLPVTRVGTDELPLSENADSTVGFSTYRLGGGVLHLRERAAEQKTVENGAPAPVGSVYTGLITEPRAGAGEHRGHLYLLWGQNTEEDLSHYRLYRSEHSGFAPDETTFVADIRPEEYRVGRYNDTGLKEHTQYFYRVCAVNQQGQCSELSPEFSAFTRESL